MMNKSTNTKKTRKSNNSLYFLYGVVLLYITLYLFNSSTTVKALQSSLKIIVQIIPVLIFVIILTGTFNYFLNKKIISKYLGENAGFKGWILSAAGGILSHGPILAWYPLLQNLQEQGMKNSFAALFLYARAIKIPLLPVMIYYFGLTFTILFVLLIFLSSLLQAKIIDLLKI